jgi:hypothetical protein
MAYFTSRKDFIVMAALLQHTAGWSRLLRYITYYMLNAQPAHRHIFEQASLILLSTWDSGNTQLTCTISCRDIILPIHIEAVTMSIKTLLQLFSSVHLLMCLKTAEKPFYDDDDDNNEDGHNNNNEQFKTAV